MPHVRGRGGLRRLLLLRASTEHASERALHALHLLLTGLLLFSSHLSQPLLTVQTDLSLDHLVVLLATLADLIPEHLALSQTLRGGRLAVQGAGGLQAKCGGEVAQAAVRLLLSLFCELLLEALAHGLLALGELCRDGAAVK